MLSQFASEKLSVDHTKRPSVYLQERCSNLLRVIDFFLEPTRKEIPELNDRLVVFLAQLGFWEWEIDNLIFSFTNFAERSRAWGDVNGFGMANGLKTQGILVRPNVVKGLKARRQSSKRSKTYAPVAELNRVIGAWNGLLAACEERILVPAEEQHELVALGVQVLPDLVRYRKALIVEPLGPKG